MPDPEFAVLPGWCLCSLSVLQASSLRLAASLSHCPPCEVDRAIPGLGRRDGLPSGSLLFQMDKEFQTPSEKRHHRVCFPMGKDVGSSIPAPGDTQTGIGGERTVPCTINISPASPVNLQPCQRGSGKELEPIRDHILPEEGRPAHQPMPTGPWDHLGRKLFLTAF